MNVRDIMLLIATSALMASAFLFVRVAAPDFGTYPLAALRVLGAAASLALLGVLGRRRMRFVRGPGPYLALGALSVAIPFALVSWAGARLPASSMSVLAATLPPFTAVVEAVWARRALHRAQWLGLAVGFAGVVQLCGMGAPSRDLEGVLAVLAPVVAAVSYALGTLYAKVRFAGVAAPELTLGSLAGAAFLLTPAALAAGLVDGPSAEAVAALAGLVVVATVAASLAYYRLLGRQGATAANCMAYLVPLFGTIYGAWFLGEAVEVSMLMGGAAIVVSVAFVTAWPGGGHARVRTCRGRHTARPSRALSACASRVAP
ncbi:MAG: DMT family transporter [Jiangellaceae bacterium]